MDAIAERERELCIDFGAGQELQLTYRAYALEVGEMIDGPRGVEAGVAQLARLLVRWDMTRAGEPIPPTAEGIRSLPGRVLQRIQLAIGEDLVVPEASASASNGG